MKLARLAICLSLALSPFAHAFAAVTTESLLATMTDPTFMPRFRDFSVRMFSSRDPSGHNEDRQQFIRMEGADAVIAEMNGPGAIVRIWAANPNDAGRIKIYLDGNPEPVLSENFKNYLEGKVLFFPEPFAQASSGGAVSYFPIPYAKKCVVKVERPKELYYQVNYITYPEGTEVQSFPGQLRTGLILPAILKAKKKWEEPWQGITMRTQNQVVAAPGKTSLGVIRSEGRIDALSFRTSPTDWRKLVLRVWFDEHDLLHPDIEAPISDLLGNPFGNSTQAASLFMGQRYWKETNTYHQALALPMPFGQSARFEIENGTDNPVAVVFAADVKQVPFDPSTTGYLHARFSQELPIPGQAHSWLESSGERGHLAGVVQAMTGPSFYFLEGDEQIAVDGEKIERQRYGEVAPFWNGTGTEDYFNSAYYFSGGLFTGPLWGLTHKYENTEPGYEYASISAWRFHLLDAPSYRKEIKAQIEHGPLNDSQRGTYYSSLVFWYSSGPAVDRKERMPEAYEIKSSSSLLVPPEYMGQPPAQGPNPFPPTRKLPTPESKRTRNKGHAVWFAPNIGAKDTLDLFTQPEKWTEALSRVEIFQIYAGNADFEPCVICNQNSLTNLVKVGAFDKLRLWGMDLAVEVGAVKPGGPDVCDATFTARQTKETLDRLKSVGAFPRYLSIDDPKASGDGPCNQSIEATAVAVARWINDIRAYHAQLWPDQPKVQIGLIEYYPGSTMEQIAQLISLIEGFGAKLDYFHGDFDYNAVKDSPDSLFKKDLLYIRSFLKSKGIRYGNLFFGFDANSPEGYWRSVMNWIVKARILQGAPDDIEFQSWSNTPQNDGSDVRLLPYNLPESDGLSHTGIINLGLKILGVW